MLKIEINTENAAFRDPYTGEPDDIEKAYELVRILKEQVIVPIRNGYKEVTLLDINGNAVGKYTID